MVATEEAKVALNYLFCHIYSWFSEIESQEEFELSHKIFFRNFKLMKETLGEHTCIQIEKLCSNLISHSTNLFHYNFKGCSTFGFKDDSIAESSFSVTKRHQFQVNSKYRIDKVGMVIGID